MFKKFFFNLNFNFLLKQIILLFIPSFLLSFLNKNYNFFFSFIPSLANFVGLDIINIFFLRKIFLSSILFFISIILIQLCYIFKIPFYIYLFFLNIFLGILSEIFFFYSKIFSGCLIVSLFFFNLLFKFNFFIIPILFFLSIWFWGLLNILWILLFKNQFFRENIFNLYKELSILIKYKYYLNYDVNNINYNLYMLSHKKVMDLIINIYEQLDILFYFNNEKYFLIKMFKIAIYIKNNLFVNLNINKKNYMFLDKKKIKFFNDNIVLLSETILNIGNNILYKKCIIFDKFLIKKIKDFNKILYKFNNILNIIYLKNIIFYLFIFNKVKYSNKEYLNDIIFIYDNRIIKYVLNININNYIYFLKLTFFFNLFFIFFNSKKIIKYYWILITIIYINQNNYLNILLKILNRFFGVLIGIIISIFFIKLYLNRFINFLLIFIFTNIGYLTVKNNYFISIIGFTISSFLNNKFFYYNVLKLFYLRLFDIIIACLISLIGNSLLWSQLNTKFFKKNINFIFKIYKKIFSKKFNNFNIIKIFDYKINFLINQMQNNIFNNYINYYNEYFFNRVEFKYIDLLIVNNYILIENINSILVLIKNKYLDKKSILYFLNIFRKYIYLNCKNFNNLNIKNNINFFYNVIYKKIKKKYNNYYNKIFIYHLYKINKHILIMIDIYNKYLF